MDLHTQGAYTMTRSELFLHEQLMLLSLKEKEGTLLGGTHYHFAIGGAVMAELLMAGRIDLKAGKKQDRVQVVDARPSGDPVIDETIEKIAAGKRPRSMQDWVTLVANSKQLKHKVARQLCRRGILRTDEDKILWIFTRKIYPELDPGPERELMDRLESVLFEGAEPDPRTAVLIALANHSRVLRAVFDKGRLKQHEERIRQISEGSSAAQATKGAIAAMEAAVAAAMIVTTT